MVGILRFGFAGICCSLVAVATLGCGSGSSFPAGTTGTLKGTVTLDGAPAPAGTTVTFIHTSAVPANAIVGPDGTYTAKMAGEPKVLTGDYRVTVADPPQKMPTNEEMAAGGQMPTAAKAVVPAKYNVPETSGLTVTVNEGENTFDIAMTSK